MDAKFINEFIQQLKSKLGPRLFNPYTDLCPFNDHQASAEIRESNLRKYMTAMSERTEGIIIGEAPGYLGCRRTGMAFTDERIFPIVRELIGFTPKIATIAGKNKEISALHVWTSFKQIGFPLFVWNIIPLHPYKDETNQLSNRTPNQSDFDLTRDIIITLLDAKDYDKILAVGRTAEKHLTNLGYDAIYIRHPSHGGSTKFKQQVYDIFVNK